MRIFLDDSRPRSGANLWSSILNSLVKIRAATFEDLARLAELLGALFEQESEMRVDREAQLRGLRSILEDSAAGEILVAQLGDDVVGMMNLLYTISTALGARAAILEDVIVAPEARGRGVGSRLIQAAIELARRRGCKRISLLTDATNTGAQRLYESLGFEASTMKTYRLML